MRIEMKNKITISPFRQITELSDDEIKQIITDLFNPIHIIEINRDNKYQEISVSFLWKWNEEEIIDVITLTMPSIIDDGIRADFSINSKDYILYNKFLLAKGVNLYLKDNPYLEDQNEI